MGSIGFGEVAEPLRRSTVQVVDPGRPGGGGSGIIWSEDGPIVTNAHAGLRLVDEEQFGTALPIIKYSKLEDALAQANHTHFGLGGSIWTANTERGTALVQELECGTGWVNQHLDITPIAPFGGAKWSGIGYENGKWGYSEFTAMQTVNVKK